MRVPVQSDIPHKSNRRFTYMFFAPFLDARHTEELFKISHPSQMPQIDGQRYMDRLQLAMVGVGAGVGVRW